jgi:hypothetical protein
MLYFKQIEIGPMQNYVYLIGSTETRKVAVVDAPGKSIRFSKLRRKTTLKLPMLSLPTPTPTTSAGTSRESKFPG